MEQPTPPVTERVVHHDGDGWVECGCGQRHWGRYGAAGLLLVGPGESRPVVLQHRALWSHHGGTWGIPGGALAGGESAVDGALREAGEEAGIAPENVRVRATWLLEHPDWSYTTVVAEVDGPQNARATDAESLDVAWVPWAEVPGRSLLPAFAASLDHLDALVGRRLVLVVDAANTMGTRPDGWWRDRSAAAARLRDELTTLGDTGLAADAHGLPGHRWYPAVHLVVEGRARGLEPAPGVAVLSAAAGGDDAIVAEVARLAAQAGNDVVVITADRELRGRVEELGATVSGPQQLLAALVGTGAVPGDE